MRRAGFGSPGAGGNVTTLSTESGLGSSAPDPGKPTHVRVLRMRGRYGAVVKPGDIIEMPLREAKVWAHADNRWGEILPDEAPPVAPEPVAEKPVTKSKRKASF